ncbi:hypothetical protein ACRALDRAFT_207846 [Sodiomyces alcalophilus JCM 7366]|uniref:uncharacterized protein n=1 Tax=Sodiomyces alcalophilus JCM 7366 TaxID=591952 RepID=UPI0039B4A936
MLRISGSIQDVRKRIQRMGNERNARARGQKSRHPKGQQDFSLRRKRGLCINQGLALRLRKFSDAHDADAAGLGTGAGNPYTLGDSKIHHSYSCTDSQATWYSVREEESRYGDIQPFGVSAGRLGRPGFGTAASRKHLSISLLEHRLEPDQVGDLPFSAFITRCRPPPALVVVYNVQRMYLHRAAGPLVTRHAVLFTPYFVVAVHRVRVPSIKRIGSCRRAIWGSCHVIFVSPLSSCSRNHDHTESFLDQTRFRSLCFLAALHSRLKFSRAYPRPSRQYVGNCRGESKNHEISRQSSGAKTLDSFAACYKVIM